MDALGRIGSWWLPALLVLAGCAGMGGGTMVAKNPVESSPQGPEVKTLVTGVEPTSIAVDEKYAYFTNAETAPNARVVMRVPLAGGVPETLETGKNVRATSIARAGNAIYWLETSSALTGGLFGLDAGGGAARQIVPSASDTPLPGGLNIAAWSRGSELLFANAYRSQLFEYAAATTAAPKPLLPEANPDTHLLYYPFSVTSDDDNVYFLSDGGILYRVPRAGGKPVMLTDKAERSPLIADGGYLYFVKGGAIVRLAAAGGEVSSFATIAGTVSDLKVFGDSLYWTCSSCGTVMKQALTATTAVTLAKEQASPSCLALDAERVYFGASHVLNSVTR